MLSHSLFSCSLLGLLGGFGLYLASSVLGPFWASGVSLTLSGLVSLVPSGLVFVLANGLGVFSSASSVDSWSLFVISSDSA